MARKTARPKWRAFCWVYNARLNNSSKLPKLKPVFNNLRKDILLQPVPIEEDKNVITDGTPNLLDLTTATNQLLDASNGHSPKSLPNNSCADEGTNNDFLDSLTQALLPNSKKPPDVEEKIAGLVNNILTGELSQDSVKERGEKYPPPANRNYLTAIMVNEEISNVYRNHSFMGYPHYQF